MIQHRRPKRHYTQQDYEYAKADWLRRNASCTSEQYQQAMQRIAARMGL